MTWLIKTEKALFYFLSLAFFWQLRLVWAPVGSQFNEWVSFYLYATDLIIAAILFLWLARRLLYRIQNKIISSPRLRGRGIVINEVSLLWLFLLFSALSLFVAQDCGLGFYRLAKLLELVGLFFYVRYNFAKLFSWQKFWQFFIAGAALQSAVAVGQFLTQHSLGLKFFAESPLTSDIAGVAKIVVGGEKIIRAYGLVPHPNLLAAILVVAIFGLVWLFVYNKSVIPAKAGIQAPIDQLPIEQLNNSNPGFRLKAGMTQGGREVLLFILIFILLSVALFFTFSRGVTMLGFLFLFFWLAVVWKNSVNKKQIILVLVLLFAIGYSLLAVYWPYFSARYDVGDWVGSQALNLRYFYNQEALIMIKQNPVLGVGLGNFVPTLSGLYGNLQAWVWQPAHNIYLLIASETGLPALLAFLVFLFLTIKSVWSQRSNPLITYHLSLITFLLVIGFFDHFLWDLQQGQILFWLMLGLLASFSPRSSMDRTQASEA